MPLMKIACRLLGAAAIVTALVCRPGVIDAQPADAFQGKTITIYVTNPPGGGYDLNSRILARHLGDHIPGHPNVIVAYMPGAHGVTGANFLFNIAPRDGTALAAPVQYLPQYQVQGIPGLEYDASKFAWIGSIAPDNEIFYVWHTVPVRSIDDMRNRETIFAGTGAVETLARLLTAVAGARFKLVKGYTGTKDANLALERGEVEGAVTSLPVLRAYWPNWLESGTIRIILYQDFRRNPDLPDVPASLELAKTPADRDLLGFFANSSSIGRAIIAPPDISPGVLAVLRTAFDATVKDPAFIAECRVAKIEVNPRTGADLQSTVSAMIHVGTDTRARIREIAGNEL